MCKMIMCKIVIGVWYSYVYGVHSSVAFICGRWSKWCDSYVDKVHNGVAFICGQGS